MDCVEWMLRSIVILNIGQLAYFNINNPSLAKCVASIIFCAILMTIFAVTLSRLSAKKSEMLIVD
jgi:hypothetical protein